jgi:riboflavin kinase/FMN adenylyltransferase
MISTSFSNFVPVIPYNHTPMKVVSDLSDPALGIGCALSIGNFDGLHLGHQAILNKVRERAEHLKLPPAVLTFDPHPVRVLAPERAPKLLTTLAQKLRLMEAAGMQLVLVAPFTLQVAALRPEDFIRRYLVDTLRAKALCVGSNFTFGNRQTGTISTLQEWRNAFECIEVPAVSARGFRVSSTTIRQRIRDGKVSQAGRMLGRWYEIEGRVVAGAGRGKNVTVPTLNLEPQNELLPLRGVYVTRTLMDSGGFVDSITNIGTRPTFDDGSTSIETFVLRDPVPTTVTTARVQFLRRIRDEQKFDSPGSLRQQIGRDVRAAERFLRMLRAVKRAEIHSH